MRLRYLFMLMMWMTATLSVTVAQPARTDAIWARKSSGAITLDGNLNEPSWALADSIKLQYGTNGPAPGSGYNITGGTLAPTDPSPVTLKLLTDGDSLYLGITVRDSSIGAGLFGQFDGLLMSIRDHSKADRPVPHFEYFYAWVNDGFGCDSGGAVPRLGQLPCHLGNAGDPELPAGSNPRRGARTDSLKKIWEGVTRVRGTTNSDATADTSYTMEVKINLKERGYNITQASGDILEFQATFYDADWAWPVNPAKNAYSRVFYQSPWGNTSWYNVARVYARPDITVSSGTAPFIAPEITIPNGAAFASPVIDGLLNEDVWKADNGKVDIRFGDIALRNSYPTVGRFLSGQFQPDVNGGKAPVLDPGDATVRWFFKGDTLFLAADVRDQSVWGINNFDQWDGIRFMITDRQRRTTGDRDSALIARTLTVRIDTVGAPKVFKLDDELPFFIDSLNGGRASLALKPGTTINTLTGVDQGYTVELALDLKKLGYPAGRGDGGIHIAACLFDAENFTNASTNYGTRTWFFREFANTGAAPAFGYMDPAAVLGTDSPVGNPTPKVFELLGNYPNPFNPTTTIRFTLPQASNLTLEVYNVVGQRVATRPLGDLSAGTQQTSFNAQGLSSGVYLYKLTATAKSGDRAKSSVSGKMTIIK